MDDDDELVIFLLASDKCKLCQGGARADCNRVVYGSVEADDLSAKRGVGLG